MCEYFLSWFETYGEASVKCVLILTHSETSQEMQETQGNLRFVVINRPGVAGAVLQTPPSLIH